MDYVSRVFDYEALARQYDVQPETLAQLVEDARKEFPNDEMMIELHVIRALRWLKRQDPN